MEAVIVLLLLVIVLMIVIAAMGVRIVRPFQRGVIEQLGKYKETVDPGLRLIVPIAQSMRKVDMREQVVDVPPQEVITADNVVVSVDAVIYYEPTDPQRLLYNIAQFIVAVTKLAQTNLRNVIGDMTLDQALTSRDTLNTALRDILDDATDKWGVRVVRVEIQRIDPPADVMHAMHEQMKAERNRRAVVTEADGAREAAIARAEGEKQSAILQAQGRRERAILVAQGDAEATKASADAESFRQRTVAEGEALAIRSVFDAINQGGGATDEVIALKYMDTLRGMADGQATKIFLPADTSSVLGTLAGMAEMFRDGSTAESTPDDQPAALSAGNGGVADFVANEKKAQPAPIERHRATSTPPPPRA